MVDPFCMKFLNWLVNMFVRKQRFTLRRHAFISRLNGRFICGPGVVQLLDKTDNYSPPTGWILQQLVESPLGCVRTGHLVEVGSRWNGAGSSRVVAEMIYGWSVIGENSRRDR